MDEETLQPEPDPAPAVHHSNVQLRDPEAPDIPASLQRELQRDQPRSRSRREAVPLHDSRRAKPIGWRVPAFVTAAILGCLALWVFWPAPNFDGEARERWVKLCRDYEEWYVPFVSRIEDTDSIALSELGLIDAQGNIGIYNFDPRYIAGVRGVSYAELAENPPSVVRTRAGVDKTRAASASIQRLLNAFDQWPVHTNLQAHLKVIEAHGWDRAARRVREVLRDAPPRGKASLGVSLHAMIGTEVRTSVIARAASQLEGDIALFERVSDPVLQHFCDIVAALTEDSLPAVSNDDAYLNGLGAALQPLAAFGDRLRMTLESDGWKNIDYAGFRDEGEAYALLKDPAFESNVVFRQWLDEASRYFAMTYDWRIPWARDTRHRLTQCLAQAVVLKDTDFPEDTMVLRKRADALDARIEALCDPVLTARASETLTRDRYVIDSEVADLVSTVDDLVTRASASGAVASILEDRPLAQRPYRSDVVDARWRSELRVLGDRLRRNSDPEAMESDAKDVRARLYALIEPGGTRSLPPAPAFGADHDFGRSPEVGALRLALTDHCRQAREAALTELLIGPLPVNPREWERLRSSYLDLLDAAERLNDLAYDTDRMFHEARLPDDPALRRGGRTLEERIDLARGPLLDDAAVSSALQPVMTRARAVIVAYREGASVNDLVATTEPITVLAAWSTGHASAEAPAQTLDFDAAQARLEVTNRIAPLIERIDDPARAGHWQSRLDQVRRADWSLLAGVAVTPDQIAVALAAADHMGLSPDAMPRRMRFNALVAHMRAAADAETTESPARRDAALLQRARTFSRGAAAFRDDPEAGPWIVKLAALTDGDHDATQEFDAAGPARAGWELVALEDDGTVTFARGGDHMRFAKLQTPTGPLYLAETELPVGTAIAAARDAGVGRDLAAMLDAAVGAETRKGPRAWVYNALANDGLTPLEPNAGPWRAGDRGDAGRASLRTPMNYVSAESAVYLAGVLGCRLPTDVEWRAAAGQWPLPASGPNLRDRAWGDYAQGVASRIKNGERGLAWADSDRLLTESSVDTATLVHMDESDGVVWLRPTPDPRVSPGPADLRGNVAELVTRRPLDPALLLDPAGGDIQGRLRAFRSAHKNDFAVMGGSALSAPGEPLDKPQGYNVFTGSRGFADVGLRLAFPAPDFSPAQRVRVLLANAPVLKPAMAQR